MTNLINVLATQAANSVGAHVPGLNAPSNVLPNASPSQIASAQFANNNVSNWGTGAAQPAPKGSPQPGNTTTGYGTGTNSPDYQAFNALYDAQTANLQNQYNAVPAYQNEAVNSIQQQYTPQYNTLQTQNASGNANLDLAQNQLDTTHNQGIRNLGNTLRTALNGYQNQIGVMGAGNSSAAPLIGYALSQQGTRQNADMNTQYDQQETGINQQRHDLQANYQNQVDTLNSWRDSNLNDIAARYSQAQQQLQSQILGADADKARYLAMYGQTALANQAIAQMQQLGQQYSNQVGQLNSHFQQVNAPSSDISQYTGQRQINAISPTQLTPLSFASNQVDTTAPTSVASLTKKPDQSPNVGIGL